MTIRNSISESFNTNQSNVGSYLVGTGIVLFISVLTMTDAQARDMYRVKPVEVVVYEGNPIDYSGRKNVIVLEETSFQNHSPNVVLVQDYTEGNSSQIIAVANNTSPSAQAKTKQRPSQKVNQQIAKKPSTQAQIARTQVKVQPRNKPVQPKAVPPRLQNIASVSRSKPVLPNKSLLPKVKDKNADLIAFYADVFGNQKKQSKKPSVSITLAVNKIPTKKHIKKSTRPNIVPSENLKRIQLAKILQKPKPTKRISNKPLKIKSIGKDSELVAFYLDVFGKPAEKITKQTSSSKKGTIKQRLAKNTIQKKTKPKKRQLAKAISKGKDPELVAFYKQIFGNDSRNSSKQVVTVANSKGKDPELVAFYQREFSKSMNNSKKRVIAKKGSNTSKTKVAAQSKVNKKKVAQKAKGKSKKNMSTAAVELQNLIDDLTSKNII